jgi:hypothetical protein
MFTRLFFGRAATRQSSRFPRNPNRSRPLTLEQLEARVVPTGDPVLHWNTVALDAAVVDHAVGGPTTQFGPTRTSRAFAIMQGAVFDAVNSIDRVYDPYLIQLPAPRNASIDAAVAEAAHETLVSLYPYQRATFDAELASSLHGIPLIPAIEGVAVGYLVAHYTLAVRANDGSQIDAVGQPVNWTYGQMPGQWRADPNHPDATPLTPDWGGVTPFVIQSSTQFRAPPPPDITSLAYAQAYEEVKAYGGDGINTPTIRNDNQENIGYYWGYDGTPGLCAPVRFYNQIAQDVAIQAGNSVVQNARMFALINFAMADAAITCWGDKYFYNYWRPVTGIQENDPGTGPSGLGSGNPYLYDPAMGIDEGDPTFHALGAPADNGSGTNFTPPFPSYTSGHATFGGATFKVLEDFYQSDTIPNGGRIEVTSDEFNSNTIDQYGNVRPILPRTYNSFSQMAGENAQSRIYLGIHWHFDAVEGIRCGNEIADYVITHALRPRHGEVTVLPSMDPEDQIALAIQLEDVAANGGLPTPPPGPGSGGSAGPTGTHPADWFGGISVHQTGEALAGTADSRPVDSPLRTQPPGWTSTTDATSGQGTATLPGNLIGHLDGGDANHDGLAVVGDISSSSLDLFRVF